MFFRRPETILHKASKPTISIRYNLRNGKISKIVDVWRRHWNVHRCVDVDAVRVESDDAEQVGEDRQLEREPETTEYRERSDYVFNQRSHDDQERRPQVDVIPETPQEEVVQLDVQFEPDGATFERVKQQLQLLHYQLKWRERDLSGTERQLIRMDLSNLGELQEVLSWIGELPQDQQRYEAGEYIEQNRPRSAAKCTGRRLP